MRGRHNIPQRGKFSFAHSEKNDKIHQTPLRFGADSAMILRNVKGGCFHDKLVWCETAVWARECRLFSYWRTITDVIVFFCV